MAQNQTEPSTEQQEESLHISQNMIDVYSQRLIGLRTQCATSAELTQQEIRSLEGKLIKMFSSQLALKAELRRKNGSKDVLSRYERIPNLEQWLQVVGLRQESVSAVCERIGSLEELQEKAESWDEVVGVLTGRREELDRLCRALGNLRRYTAILQDGTLPACPSTSSDTAGSNISLLDYGNHPQHHHHPFQPPCLTAASPVVNNSHSHTDITMAPLYWDSWDRRTNHHGHATAASSTTSSPRPIRATRPAYRASIPNEDSHHHQQQQQQQPGIAEPPAGAPVLVVSSSVGAACDGRPAVVEGVGIVLCNGGGISGSVSSSALYYGSGGGAGGMKSPASPVSPTFSLGRKPPGLSNCRTPPACRKNTCLPTTTTTISTNPTSILPPLCGTPTSLDFPPTLLIKSKSHESQLLANDQINNSPKHNNDTTTTNNDINNVNNALMDLPAPTPPAVAVRSSPVLRRERLPTEPGPEYGSTYDVAQLLDVQQLQQMNCDGGAGGGLMYRQVHVNVVVQGELGEEDGVVAVTSQTAPPSPRVLRHRIEHRFQKTFKMMASCGVCLKPIYFGTGLRCKECKYRCHRDCEDKAVASCGLTPELLKAVKDAARGNRYTGGGGTTSGNCLPNRRKNSAPPSQMMYGPNYSSQQQQTSLLKDHQYGGSGSFLSNLLSHNKHKQHTNQQQKLLSATTPGGGDGGKHTQQQQPSSQPSSTANSSCNSSAPSSPAPGMNSILSVNGTTYVAGGGGGSSNVGTVTRSSFHFPDPVSDGCNGTTLLNHLQLLDRAKNTMVCEQQQHQQQQQQQQYNSTTSHHNSNSNHTPQLSKHNPPLSPLPTRVDSQDSQMSSDTETLVDIVIAPSSSGGIFTSIDDASNSNSISVTTITSTNNNTTTTTTAGHTTLISSSSSTGNQRQNSMTTALKEWDIPFSELILEGAGPLGAGRFGTVWRGQWHGDVAIKILHGQDEARTLQQFRSDVSTFRKTRHENLVLFMGACTRPPHLAIVTSLCKGQTLHSLVHLRRERFSLARAAAIAQQINQGMGYLHAKGILHKDLTSKNVFLENQGTKVVITDFGLFSGLRNDRGMSGDSSGNRLAVPSGWLCYLAPELVRALTPTPTATTMSGAQQQQQPVLPFSRAADVFAFGTIWFELLCGDWPFRGEPPEAVIWQVGAGRKVSLTNLHATKDVKDVLMACWAYNPEDREDFAALLERLQRLPTAKRLARSPSHPVHLSRSAESVF